MAYSQDLSGAARRHLATAELIDGCEKSTSSERAVAGYLFGLAGELALKQLMRESGMRPLPPEERRNDPFYAHFPQLRAMLSRTATGRRQGDLIRHASNQSLFQQWDTDMRYAPSAEITPASVEIWKTQAKALVSEIGL